MHFVRRGVYDTSVTIYIDDRPMTDQISNGDISATGHPIHFMFGSGVGFSGLADRMALLPVGSNVVGM